MKLKNVCSSQMTIRTKRTNRTDRINRRTSTNGKEWGEHGGVWESDGEGIGEFLAAREVGSSMGEI